MKNFTYLNEQNAIMIEENSHVVIKSIINDKKIVYKFYYYDSTFEFQNKMVNDHNQYFSGDWFLSGLDTSNDVLFERVIQGLKPLCVFTEKTEEKILKYLNRIDFNRFSIKKIYDEKNKEFILWVARKGKIKNLFDLKALERDYKKNLILIDLKRFENRDILDCFFPSFKLPLYLFGLLFGYPIENTMSLILEQNQK